MHLAALMEGKRCRFQSHHAFLLLFFHLLFVDENVVVPLVLGRSRCLGSPEPERDPRVGEWNHRQRDKVFHGSEWDAGSKSKMKWRNCEQKGLFKPTKFVGLTFRGASHSLGWGKVRGIENLSLVKITCMVGDLFGCTHNYHHSSMCLESYAFIHGPWT